MTSIKSTTDEDIVLDLKKLLFELYLNLQNQTFYNLSMLSLGDRKMSVALPLTLCKPYICGRRGRSRRLSNAKY